MGTPEFAAVSLRALVEHGHSICGVFTQPDRPKNRGHKIALSPVKEYALSQNLEIFQPASFRDPAVTEQIRALAPELSVVAAYGKILPEEVLQIPSYGTVNVHSSLLPKYRGAAPIQHAILNGETQTGVSIMYLVKELDAGDVILQKSTPIGEQETAQELTVRLAELGAQALVEALGQIASGTASRTPQDETLVTYAPMLSKEDSPVDWTRPAHALHCQIRGLIPWPCAATEQINGESMKLWAAEETGKLFPDAEPGKIVSAGKQGIEIVCGDGKSLYITELQAQNGKRMSAGNWLLGHPLTIG